MARKPFLSETEIQSETKLRSRVGFEVSERGFRHEGYNLFFGRNSRKPRFVSDLPFVFRFDNLFFLKSVEECAVEECSVAESSYFLFILGNYMLSSKQSCNVISQFNPRELWRKLSPYNSLCVLKINELFFKGGSLIPAGSNTAICPSFGTAGV